MRLAFVAVFSVAFGVLLRDVAQDYLPESAAATSGRETAERYAAAVAECLNGGAITDGSVVARCRVKSFAKSFPVASE